MTGKKRITEPTSVTALTELALKRIIEFCAADLEDYTQLIRLTERLQKMLASDQGPKMPAVDNGSDREPALAPWHGRQDMRNVSPSALSSSAVSPSILPPSTLEGLTPLVAERNSTFETLESRADQVRGWQAELCRGLGIKGFTLENLDGRIAAQDFTRLSQCSLELQKRMDTLRQLTFELKEMFEQELEGTKLELHRLQGGKRLRRAYYAQEDPEARFIDKEK